MSPRAEAIAEIRAALVEVGLAGHRNCNDGCPCYRQVHGALRRLGEIEAAIDQPEEYPPLD